LFFFSSRRRHTRFSRDWSSDVCSSDLTSTSLAMLLALVVANIFKPGAGMELALFQDVMQNFEAHQLSMSEFFTHFFHGLFQNPFAAFAQGNILAVVIFALFIGIALVIGGERYQTLLKLLQEFLDLIMRIVGWIMYLAPIGIFALLTKLIATQEMDLLATVGQFIVLIFSTTLVHGLITLPLLVWLVTKKSPLWFLRGAREAMITAFATSSSTASLPVTLRCAQDNLKVRRDIAGFVAPLGATANMDGTALYEAAAALFVANLVGLEWSLARQLVV